MKDLIKFIDEKLDIIYSRAEEKIEQIEKSNKKYLILV